MPAVRFSRLALSCHPPKTMERSSSSSYKRASLLVLINTVFLTKSLNIVVVILRHFSDN